jgi:hypothetical protein
MKKTLSLILDEQDFPELLRIVADEDGRAALAFLKKYARSRARELLEGG